MNDSAAVRNSILDALRLDLVGPRPGEPGHDAYSRRRSCPSRPPSGT